MVHSVEVIVLSDFLTGNSAQTYQRYVQVAKFSTQRPSPHQTTKDIDEEERASRMLSISHNDDGTLTSSWTEN